MEGKANITIGQVNNEDKQKVSLSYFIGSFDNVQDAQIAKFAFDQVAEELGATVVNDACILGESEDRAAKEDAEKIVLNVEEKDEPNTPETSPATNIPKEKPQGAIPQQK